MTRSVSSLVLLALLIAGCASQFPQGDSRMESPQAEFDLPAKELAERVKEVLSSPPIDIGVEEQNQGSILTGYQRFPGEWHIARRWQERTRYRINIMPDFDQPGAKSRLQVREFTEQRAAEGMKWEVTNDLQRLERSAALLRELEAQLRAPATRAS